MNREGYAFTDVRMAYDAPIAVVAATYSGRKSRIVLWHTDTDTFQHGQWLKGGIELLDLSADGRYLGYYVQTFHKPVQSYMAVSRPPYLTALAFIPCFHLNHCDIYFGPESSLQWFAGAPIGRTVRDNPELNDARIEPGCPLEGQPYKGDPVDKFFAREVTRLGVTNAAGRFGDDAKSLLMDATLAPRFYPGAGSRDLRRAVATWDHNGRLILCCNGCVTAYSQEHSEGELLLDLNDRTFREMATPDWAKTWTEMPDEARC
jgi:hypothetical protein